MKCDHLHTIYKFSAATTQQIPGFNKFVTKCTRCELHGPVCYSPEEATKAFWEKDKERKKSMSTEDYKRGVEDALSAITSRFTIGTYSPDFIKEKSTEQVKKLLTKKVTKWVNVYRGLPRLGYASLSTSENLYDTREEAVKQSSDSSGVPSIYTLGTYPIEIELPL